MAYVVVYGGTDNNTDAVYCLTLGDVKDVVEQELEDYGPESAADLKIFEVGKQVSTTVTSMVKIG